MYPKLKIKCRGKYRKIIIKISRAYFTSEECVFLKAKNTKAKESFKKCTRYKSNAPPPLLRLRWKLKKPIHITYSEIPIFGGVWLQIFEKFIQLRIFDEILHLYIIFIFKIRKFHCLFNLLVDIIFWKRSKYLRRNYIKFSKFYNYCYFLVFFF